MQDILQVSLIRTQDKLRAANALLERWLQLSNRMHASKGPMLTQDLATLETDSRTHLGSKA